MKTTTHGGKRKGAGRPSQGKSARNVSLTDTNVKAAKARVGERNFSGLIDRLLADWLKR